MKFKFFIVSFVVFLCSNSLLFSQSYKYYLHPQDKPSLLSQSTINLLDTIQRKSFLYFLNETNASLGLVRDRSADYSPASIAAIGFALPCYAIAAEHGWITRQEALIFTRNLLKFLLSSEQSNAKSATGYKGFYYHFLHMKTGKREWNCELSTIDTALLFAGIIFARQYFKGNTPEEIELRVLAERIIRRADWNFFIKTGNDKYSKSISLGWDPVEGMHPMGWIGYNEALILYIIAAGSGMNDAEQSYQSWLNSYDWREPYPGIPLFFRHIPDFAGIVSLLGSCCQKSDSCNSGTGRWNPEFSHLNPLEVPEF